MSGANRIDEVLDMLLKIRQRLSNPENWCSMGALNDAGGACLSMTLFSLAGSTNAGDETADLLNTLTLEVAGQCVPDFNDTHTHAEVLDLLDKAIERRTQEIAA